MVVGEYFSLYNTYIVAFACGAYVSQRRQYFELKKNNNTQIKIFVNDHQQQQKK